jgi:CRISPR/Cas system-associated endonuclease Cas1
MNFALYKGGCMSKNFYIFSNGRLRRKQNTVFLETEKEKIPIPVEELDQIFVLGETDMNTKFLNCLAGKGITLHVFNYYWYVFNIADIAIVLGGLFVLIDLTRDSFKKK